MFITTALPIRHAIRVVAAAAAAAAVVLAASCGHSQKLSAAPAGSPQQVAIVYSQAILAGRVDDARGYVAPASQPAFQVIAGTLGQAGGSARDLASGSVTISGASAVVVLTGTLCYTGTCISNSSSQSANPIFKVSETRIDGRWMVTFNTPSVPVPAATSTVPASVAPAHP